MGWENVTRVSWFTVATAAAVLTAALKPRSDVGYTPVLAELICWVLVIAYFGLLQRVNSEIWKGHGVASTASLPYLYWTAAFSITVIVASSSFADFTWITPVVAFALIARRSTSLLTRLHASLPKYLRYSWLAAIGVLFLASLAPSLDTKSLASAIPIALGLVGTYASLIHIFRPDNDRIDGRERLETRTVINSIASRTIGLLVVCAVVMTLVWPGSTLDTTNAAVAGGLKAAHWVVIFWLTQEIPWEIAPTIWAYVAASASSSHPISDSPLSAVQTLMRIAIAILNLYQTIDFVPKTEKGRALLTIFALWPISSVVQHTTLSQRTLSLPDINWLGSPGKSPYHPVELLIRKGQEDFKRLIDQQSQTLESAETEYRRRYSRSPPPGFDKWFAYARSKDSVFIDDFDMINENLKPFWKIAPQRLRDSIGHASSLKDVALHKCGIDSGKFYSEDDGWMVIGLAKLLKEVTQDIPNFDFAFNVLDEPRVIITQQMLDTGGVSTPEFYSKNKLPIWDRITSSCARTKPSEKSPSVYDYGLKLVQDWHQSKDVCLHPEFASMHSFFSSPMTSLLTDAPIPILSQAAPTSFNDIMYPSPWYSEKMDQREYQDEEDPPWEQKANNLYWAGSTTGSYGWNGTWRHSHRQRFVTLVQTLNQTDHIYLEESKPGQWISYKAVKDHSNLFDVKFTAIIQCADQDCEEQKKSFTVGEREDPTQQYHSRFTFDLDGNSFSGRFYPLLRSRSVVLKQTVLREWHDERLIPWVHFIPISLSMEELPEIMRYMTSHENGKKRAREIAEAGREWHGKVLRKEDFTIYLYRLMLEMARIMDPERLVES